MAAVFTAYKPEAAAARLCTACRWFSGSGLVCLRQRSCWQQEYLVAVFGIGAKKKKNFPIFFFFFTGASSETFGCKIILCDVGGFFSVVLLL